MQAVLAIVVAPGGAEVVRRPGLKALARLASGDRQTLLEIGSCSFRWCVAKYSARTSLVLAVHASESFFNVCVSSWASESVRRATLFSGLFPIFRVC